MRTIKERYRFALTGAVLCACAAVCFVCISVWYAAALSAAGAAALTGFTVRSSADYRAARLIADNPILSVDIARVAEAGNGAVLEASVDVVVSGFGILMDGRPYRFGHSGINLQEVCIDHERIALSFGGEGKRYSVSLLHGVSEPEDIEKLRNRLRHSHRRHLRRAGQDHYG